MADPGTIIAALTIAYSCAIKAWSAFQTALDYDDDSANLVVRLEIEKFRLQTWALNVGLTKGTFDANLHPIHELIAERLNRITKLFEEAEKVKDSFGLVTSEASKIRPDKVHGIMNGMALSIRGIGIRLDIEEKPKELDVKSIPNRIRWTLTSKSKFLKLVSTLEEYIDKLDALLTETQRRAVKDDWKQINIIIVGNIPAEHIDLIQQAFRPNIADAPSKSTSGIESLIERKAIQTSKSIRSPGGAQSLERRDLDGFVLSADVSTQNRVLAAPKQHMQAALGPGPFMLERKQYYPNISLQDKTTEKPSGQIDPPSEFFKCPFSIASREPSKFQAVSLRSLFSLKHKSTLEDRFRLANLASKTLAELFNSGWMHKGIRSENVLFPEASDEKIASSKDRIVDVSSPYLAGFEYSHQDTEVTIDNGRHLRDISSAIYRHPDYQGEAAFGYRMKYDIYSFGLVLVEIALWTPLLILLDAKGGPLGESVQLSSKMKTFRREEALELKKRVLERVDRELGFRVGSRFREVVRWCLTMSEGEDEEEWHPALGFHNHVVAPLERCTILGEE